MLVKIKDRTLKAVNILFEGTMGLVDTVFKEVFTLTDWAFRVGTRIALLYLLYELAVGDLISKVLEVL